MDNLIKQFKSIREECSQLLDLFPTDKIEEKLFGGWDLKDVVAHFTGWDAEFTNTIQAFRNRTLHPYWGKIYEFNDKVVSASKKKTWKEVRNEFDVWGTKFIESYIGYPKDLLQSKIWKDKIYTPKRILEINIHHYQKAQFVKIQKMLNQK